MKRYFGFDPYEGDGKYGFVSYKSEEYINIGKYAKALNQKGINLWYDYGIPAGKDWDKIISEHIVGASFIVLFVTEKVFESSVIMREIQTAEEWDIPVVPVFIENIDKSHIVSGQATFFTQLKHKQGVDNASQMSEEEVADSLYELVGDIMKSDSEYAIEYRKERLNDENSSQSGVLADVDSLLKAAIAEVRADKNLETEIEQKTEPINVGTVISDNKLTPNKQALSEKSKLKITKRAILIAIPILVIVIGIIWRVTQPAYHYIVNDDGTATITHNTNLIVKKTVKEVIIPNKINGYEVTSIGDGAFANCDFLKEVTIPNSVTVIDANAFNGCYSLKSIIIPDSVTSIGGGAFSACESLESIIIPNSVTYIGDDAFLYCSSLASITIPDSVTYIGGHAFGYYMDVYGYVCYPDFTIYGKSGSTAEVYAKENNIPFVAE